MSWCIGFGSSRRGEFGNWLDPFAGIAISNQRETSLAWRRAAAGSSTAGEPLTNAITWQCRRSTPVCEKLAGQGARIQAVTGLPLDPLVGHRASGYEAAAAKERTQRRKDLGIVQGGGYA